MSYKRYDDEWEKEVIRNPKKLIVEMLRNVAKERDRLYAAQPRLHLTASGAGGRKHPAKAVKQIQKLLAKHGGK